MTLLDGSQFDLSRGVETLFNSLFGRGNVHAVPKPRGLAAAGQKKAHVKNKDLLDVVRSNGIEIEIEVDPLTMYTSRAENNFAVSRNILLV
nr:hypothetical protein [Tanacetum cinerariifolium]